MRDVRIHDHPLLRAGLVQAGVEPPAESPEALLALLRADAGPDAGVPPEFGFDPEALQPRWTAVRDVLRHPGGKDGFKPTGRNKPAAEYLAKVAARDGAVNPIHPLVDVNNVVSLHSGLPISLFDLGPLRDPLEIRRADPGASYVFNVSGQEIDVGGLLCLHDADGPVGNAVKDSNRAKVGADTRQVLLVAWGPQEEPDPVAPAARWIGDLLTAHCAASGVETAFGP